MEDDELLPISGLQHFVFCARQCALIHVEREWEDNRLTAQGTTLHHRVDEGYRELRRGSRQFAGVRVQSRELGLYGRLDVLEAARQADSPDNAVFLGLSGCWQLQPVEFKRGKPKVHDADRVQLCAQAMCVEEMTGAQLPGGSLFYGELRRRVDVELDGVLRARTREVANGFRKMIAERELPKAVFQKHCRACSLVEICQPRSVVRGRVDAYRKELLG